MLLFIKSQKGEAWMDREINSYRVLLTQREYVKLTAANLVNRFGDSIDTVVFTWIMYQITQSASLMALLLGLNYLPTILLQPMTGSLVERLSKKRVMVCCDLMRGLIVLAVVFLYANGLLSPALLVCITLANSTVEAFRTPAGISIVPLLIREEHYTIGVAFNQALSRAVELIGLAAAGGLASLLGYELALTIDAAAFILSAFLIALIYVKEPACRSKRRLRVMLNDFLEGIRLVRSHRILPALLFVAALINLTMVPLSAFSTAYVDQYLQGNETLLAAVQFLLVGGTMVGSAVSPKLFRPSRRAQLLLFGMLASLSLAALGAGAHLHSREARMATALTSYFLQGLSAGVLNVIFSSSLMRNVPKPYMARLSGLSNAVMTCSIPIGSLLCSGLAALVPLSSAFLAAAVLSAVLFLVTLGIREFRRL